MAPGEGGLREVFNRVPDDEMRGGIGCELLRPYLELDALRATVDPFFRSSRGTRCLPVPSTFFFFFFFCPLSRGGMTMDWAGLYGAK
jgi:hypothetical protein